MAIHHVIDEPVESTPLLNDSDGTSSSSSSSSYRSRSSRPASIASFPSISVPKVQNPNTAVAIMCALIFVASGSGGFFIIPMTRIFEDRFCQEYYSSVILDKGAIDEDLCKVDVVQSKLAYLFAVDSFIGAAMGCIVAMPWGLIADRIGRRPVFILGVFGMALASLWQMAVGWFSNTLPIHLYWLSSLGLIVGGGNAALNAVVSSMMSDVLPEADRAIGFMRVHVASMLGAQSFPVMCSFLMPRIGPWPLIWTSTILGFGSAFGILLIPESSTPKPPSEDETDPEQSFTASISRSLAGLKDSLSMLKTRSVVLLMLCCLTIMPVFYCTSQLLTQYVSKRYHIKLESTGYIQGTYGAAHVVVILLIIPWLSALVMRPTSPRLIRMANEHQRDLSFTRWSFVALVAGTLVMCFSPVLPTFICGLFLMALGSGAGSYIPSTLAFYVDKEHRTRMFSLIGIVQIMGSLYAMPMLAALFSAGMKMGGAWIGLPYLGVAVLCVLAIVLLAFVQLSKADGNGDDGEETSTSI